jgi:hypothetical protein
MQQVAKFIYAHVARGLEFCLKGHPLLKKVIRHVDLPSCGLQCF